MHPVGASSGCGLRKRFPAEARGFYTPFNSPLPSSNYKPRHIFKPNCAFEYCEEFGFSASQREIYRAHCCSPQHYAWDFSDILMHKMMPVSYWYAGTSRQTQLGIIPYFTVVMKKKMLLTVKVLSICPEFTSARPRLARSASSKTSGLIQSDKWQQVWCWSSGRKGSPCHANATVFLRDNIHASTHTHTTKSSCAQISLNRLLQKRSNSLQNTTRL